jgi:hypothetical protein
MRAAGFPRPRKRIWPKRVLLAILRRTLKRNGVISRRALERHRRPGFLGIEYSIRLRFGSLSAAKASIKAM